MSNSASIIIYVVVIVAIFYFLMFRPEKKRKKQQQEMRDSLKVGSDITTIGGIIGTIVEIDDDFVTFETGEDRVRIKISKWGISTNSAVTAEQAKKQA